jgi:hypothetical protein
LGTARIDKIVQDAENQICVSRLTVVELPSVFAIKVRTGFISREDAALLMHQFRDDIVSRQFDVFPLREPDFAVAEQLLGRYAFDWRLRALDALQLAVAINLRAQNVVEYFVAADKIQCTVAVQEAFTVINPDQ